MQRSEVERARGGGRGAPRPKLSRAALLFRPTIPPPRMRRGVGVADLLVPAVPLGVAAAQHAEPDLRGGGQVGASDLVGRARPQTIDDSPEMKPLYADGGE